MVWGLRQTNIKTPENTNMKMASAFKRDAILEMNTHFIWNALSDHQFEMFVKFNGIIEKKTKMSTFYMEIHSIFTNNRKIVLS